MATIPIYQQQVDAKPTPGFRQESVATPGLLGGAADNIVQASKSMTAIGGQLDLAQERQDMTGVLAVEAARKEKMISFDAEMRKTRTGGNAEGTTQGVKQWWDEAAKEDTANLNDTQRAIYQRRMAATRLGHIHTSSQFEANQLDQYLGDTTKAAVVAATNTAAANAFNKETGKVDETGVALQDNAIVTALTALAKRKGEDKKGPNGEPSPLEVAIGEARTRMHKEVLQALPPELARDYFLAHEQEIDGSQRDSIGKAARAQTADALGQKAAKEEIAAAGGYGAGIDVVLERLDKRFGSDTVTLKAAHAAAKDMTAAYEHGEKTRMDSMKASVNQRLLQGESWSSVKNGPEYKKLLYDSGPAGVAAAGQIQDHQESLGATRASRAASASNRSYTEAAHRQLDLGTAGLPKFLTLTNDLDTLAATDTNALINMRTEMSDQQVQHLVQLKTQITKSAEAMSASKVDANMFKTIARGVGFTYVDDAPSKRSEEQNRRLGDLQNAANEALAVAAKAKGRPINDPRERQKVIQDAVYGMVKIPGWFGDTTLPAAVLLPAEQEKAVVSTPYGTVKLAEIPTAYRDKAEAYYASRGKKPTLAEIATDYARDRQNKKAVQPERLSGPHGIQR